MPAMRLKAPLAIIAGAVALRLVIGVGFANYDTLYALSWGGQLARGETPAYGVPVAPTPHPLLELLDHMTALGFLHSFSRLNYLIVDDVEDILPSLRKAAARAAEPATGDAAVLGRL